MLSDCRTPRPVEMTMGTSRRRRPGLRNAGIEVLILELVSLNYLQLPCLLIADYPDIDYSFGVTFMRGPLSLLQNPSIETTVGHLVSSALVVLKMPGGVGEPQQQ